MQEIDLKSICVLLLAKLKWLVVGMAVGLLLFGSYAYFLVPAEYTASALVYVRNTKEGYDINGTTNSNLTAAQQLVANYTIHMNTRPVLDKAVARLGGRLSAGELKAASSASGQDETSWLKISVTLGDPDLAMEACTAIADASAETFGDLEASSATVREYPTRAAQVAPNVIKTALVGALLGLVVPAAFVLIRQLADNTIHDKFGLRQRLDVPVLGEIPSFELAASRRSRKGGRTHA